MCRTDPVNGIPADERKNYAAYPQKKNGVDNGIWGNVESCGGVIVQPRPAQ